MLADWDYREVQDFDALAKLWEYYSGSEPEDCQRIGDVLRKRLGLPIVDMDPEESKFFKHHYKSNFQNKGIMSRE
jgi:hypothetical protein